MNRDASVEARGVRALSGDAELLDHLRPLTGTGSVHSVFARVVNLLTPDGTLVALAARTAGDAPRTLVLDLADWTGTELAAGGSVTFAEGNLRLGSARHPLLVTTAEALPWHAVAPSLAHLAPGALAAAADALERLNDAHGARGGMLGAAPGAGLMEQAVARALDDGRTRLLAAVRARDVPGIRAGVLSLLGLGPGLTPAGDDFLGGLALVAALPGSALAHLTPVLRDVLPAHLGRTTDLSHATLFEAVEGRVRGDLIDVLRELADTTRPPQALHVPARKVLAVGHTSGSDTLSGLTAGLHLEEELRGSL
ncbi:DUF2877 domain-containing protein [Streptomyces sp. SID8379]|uniref:oxamate carbamoyltransferase subunit AllH family protein n=1 Tax=unclassified Streptomyces TaxID=2593676 RepID=UPI0003779085|nr:MULTISPECIES: DUF2877 domain-containing protein [unclassified Streptomyces]MYW69791.1 DUF2877 domain-containing protein [Streptomyces sp. SID8379]